MTADQRHPPYILYGVTLNEAISRGNLNEMQEMAVVSGYLQRTQPLDPSSEEGRAWADAHEKLMGAISDKVMGSSAPAAVGFEIGGQMPGAPLLRLSLILHADSESLTGMAHITQSTHPPLNFVSKIVDGRWMTFLLMGAPSMTNVTATGIVPKGRSLSESMVENFELFMSLNADGKTGLANYKYMGARDGQWHHVVQAPVKRVDIPQAPAGAA